MDEMFKTVNANADAAAQRYGAYLAAEARRRRRVRLAQFLQLLLKEALALVLCLLIVLAERGGLIDSGLSGHLLLWFLIGMAFYTGASVQRILGKDGGFE